MSALVSCAGHLPGEDPIGRTFNGATMVGVVGDVRQNRTADHYRGQLAWTLEPLSVEPRCWARAKKRK
jgi:hypothetical protein